MFNSMNKTTTTTTEQPTRRGRRTTPTTTEAPLPFVCPSLVISRFPDDSGDCSKYIFCFFGMEWHWVYFYLDLILIGTSILI